MADILNSIDAERRALVRDGDIVEVLPRVTRMRPIDGSFHTVISSSLTNDTADAAIVEQVEHYRALGVGFEWKVFSHDTPADMVERLTRQRFVVGPCEAVMVLGLAEAPEWVNAPVSHEVVRLERVEQVEIFRAAAGEIFGKDYGFTARQLCDAIRAGSKQHVGYVAMCDGTPAGVGRLYTHPDSVFGGLYGGGTLSPFRGRGVYRALVTARARDARALGAKYLMVDALPTSRPILERLGFERVADTWPCEWSPDGER
jgi:GNAT superfamily N-acetyltransferase